MKPRLRKYTESYVGVRLPDNPTLIDVEGVLMDYRNMCVSVMTSIADRFDRSNNCGFIDTKINLLSGEDFGEDDFLRGPKTILGYIQGRGLEAIVEHCNWLNRACDTEDAAVLVQRLSHIVKSVHASLRVVRAKNGGHLYFYFSTDGQPYLARPNGQTVNQQLTEDSNYNKSDLFGAKGMYVAGQYLECQEAVDEARAYCLSVDSAVWNGRFASDQQPIAEGSTSVDSPLKVSHTPWMLELDTAYILLRSERSRTYRDFGLRLIRRIIAEHVCTTIGLPGIRLNDFWEYVTPEKTPYQQQDVILSDPGHAIEFVGLAMRFLDLVEELQLSTGLEEEIEYFDNLLPSVMMQSFDIGFNWTSGGLCRSVDLSSRQRIEAHMPWWSLPEAIRAAAYCWKRSSEPQVRQRSLFMLAACHNAFTNHYVKKSLMLMAIQTRSEQGIPIGLVPATSDADPGYHTGLSLLDAIRVFSGMDHYWQHHTNGGLPPYA